MSPLATATPQLSYVLAQANGRVEPLGGAAYYGSVFGMDLVAPIVALLSTPDHKGYWLVGADGSMYRFGDAHNEGDAAGEVRPDPVVAAAVTNDGAGYWLVTASGHVMAFGDAKDYGSIETPLRAHVVGIVATRDGKGYWIVYSTGGVFNFGDAPVHRLGKGRHTRVADCRCGRHARRRGVLARRRERVPLQLRRRRGTCLVSPPRRPSSASRSRRTGPAPGWPNKTAP